MMGKSDFPDEVAAAAGALAAEWPGTEPDARTRAARAALNAASEARGRRIEAQVEAEMAERRRVLVKHGIAPDLAVRGVAGDIHEVVDLWNLDDPHGPRIRGRNHICELDGVEIDGHSDPYLSGGCIYCHKDDEEW